MMVWTQIVERLRGLQFRLRYRIKQWHVTEPDMWCDWLIAPSNGYLETGSNGPIKTRSIEWVDIDPMETGCEGRLVQPRLVDRTGAIVQVLRMDCVLIETTSGLVRVRVQA